MIDINELRRLAQAATPGPWKVGQYLGSLRQFVIHMDVGDRGRGSDVAFTSTAFGNDETIANASFIAAANPATIIELLDRLEAAESDGLEQARLNGMGGEREAALLAKLEAAEKTKSDWLRANAPGGWIDDLRVERDALRAKIERMEKQEPVGVVQWIKGWPVVNARDGVILDPNKPLYALPGAQPAPSESEERMRWLLRQIVSALPSRRDWLDPAIEEEAKLAAAPNPEGE